MKFKLKTFLLYSIVTLLYSSCGTILGDDNEVVDSILNNSNQSVIMKLSLGNGFVEDRFIELLNGQIYEGREIEPSTSIPLTDPNSASPSTSLAADSIVFIFNNERMMSWFLINSNMSGNVLDNFSLPLERNPLRRGNYDQISDEEFQYVITQEDFDNATPCDGPCE